MGDANDMDLIYSLIGYPDETEWIEFKGSNAEPMRIGQDISALANAAAFHGREYGYKVWGVEDGTHRLIGTEFDPYHAKAKGNQDLLIWLRGMLSSNAAYEFRQVQHGGMRFVVLVVAAAVGQPVSFGHVAYMREGSSTTPLVAGSRKEADFWQRLQTVDYESHVAVDDLTSGEMLDMLDVDAFYRLLDMRRPGSEETALRTLCEQGLIRRRDSGRFAVNNLGMLLIGKSLSSVSRLRKRALRVVTYAGKANLDILDDKTFDAGYALILPDAERYVMSRVPARERDEGAFRRLEHVYPQRAVRELLGNAVIHQDLADASAGPLVSIHANRIQFSNPGVSLIPEDRLLNALPKTRNPSLAGILRQMDLCEEGGTGWDRAVAACEEARMAAPKMRTEEGLGTVVTLFAEREYDRMTKAERKEAVYWHACLLYAQDESMGNQSLRERFGLDDSRKSMVAMSRLIRECCDEGLIKEEDADASDRYRRYIPAWA